MKTELLLPRASRRGVHGLFAAGFFKTLLMTTALTWPGAAAHAQCETDPANIVNCTGDHPDVLDGINDGPDFDVPPVNTINVFDIQGIIEPDPGIDGVSAVTSGVNQPLKISVDTGLYRIRTLGGGDGIRVQAAYDNSPVDITNRGTIFTEGLFGDGIDVLGNGNNSKIIVRNYNAIVTNGAVASGVNLLAGDGISLTNTPIELFNYGEITTYLSQSAGIKARVGGGEKNPITLENSGTIETFGDFSSGISTSVTGDDSPIVLTNLGAITLVGPELGLLSERTSGIFATSKGNRGGYGLRSGIDITNKGVITTHGDDVMGIYASTFGSESPVTINNEGAITTEGDRTFSAALFPNISGIFAYAAGPDSPVIIDNSADVIASGAGAKGIHAFSLDISSDVTINLYGGVVRGGSGDGDGIDLTASEAIGTGVANESTVNVYAKATVTTLGANAVRAGDGDDTVNNWGTVIGNINLGGGTNAFYNKKDGLFNAGPIVDLGGDGKVLTNEGILSPGGTGSIQTTTLTGDLEHQASGVFQVDVDGAVADRLDVSGTATIDGGEVRVSGVPLIGRDYTILSADALVVKTGFNVLASTGRPFFAYALEYDYGFNHINLTATRIASFCDIAGTANQQAVACDGLDSLPLTYDIVQAVLGLTSEEEVQAAYDALSGEVQASLKGALMDNGQALVDAVNRRMNAGFGNPDTAVSTAAFGDLSSLADGNNGFWITGYGSWGETDATANTAQMDNDLGGVVFGIDRAFAEIWRFGVLGGYSQSDVSQNALQSSASADTWSLGLYGGAEAGANVLSFGAVYSWHAIDTARTVSFPGVPQSLSASYDAQSWQLFAEAGHKVRLEHIVLEPFAGVSFISLDTDGYTETGGSAALTAASDTQDTTFTTLGVRSSMQVMNTVRTRGMIGWRHAFGDTDPTSVFTLAGSNPFTITGAPIAQDALVTELGLEAQLSDNAFLGASYNGQYGDGTTTHGFNAGFRARF